MRGQRAAGHGAGHVHVDAVKQHARGDQRHDAMQHARFFGAVYAPDDGVDRLFLCRGM